MNKSKQEPGKAPHICFEKQVFEMKISNKFLDNKIIIAAQSVQGMKDGKKYGPIDTRTGLIIQPDEAFDIAKALLTCKKESTMDINLKKQLDSTMCMLFSYYTKSKELSGINPMVYFYVANIMFYNINNKGDFAKAFKFFNLSLKHKIHDSLYYISLMYKYGLGIDIDEVKALQYLLQYIENYKVTVSIIPNAYLEIALSYYYKGNSNDYSLKYFLKAYEKGIELSAYYIAQLYCCSNDSNDSDSESDSNNSQIACSYFNKAILIPSSTYPDLYFNMIFTFYEHRQFTISNAIRYFTQSLKLGTKDALSFLEVLYPDLLNVLTCTECRNCCHSAVKNVLAIYRESRSNDKNNFCNCKDICYCIWLHKFLITYYLQECKTTKVKKHKYNLGNLYLLTKKYKEAFVAYSQSAADNFAPAQYQLFLCYYKGKGTEKNKQLAMKYLKLSALKGFAQARNMTAKLNVELL